ncbi:hypothetical protein GXW82_35985 [Streptacidiphilus sp. 4-A2]|nr:hypothetical protein [Streptacidiphilus sp. 4-A2]
MLAQYADHPSLSVRGQLAWGWERFDTREYGDRVIARMPYRDGLRFIAKTPDQLAYLAGLGGRPSVECSGSFTDEQLRTLPREPLEAFRLHENPLPVDLSWLADCPELAEVQLINCSGEMDLRLLTRLGLERLVLAECPGLRSVGSLAEAGTLRRLRLGAVENYASTPVTELALPPSLESLHVYAPVQVTGLDRCRALARVRFEGQYLERELWEQLGQLPRLEQLSLFRQSAAALSARPPLPSVRELRLYQPLLSQGLDVLPQLFPGLERLRLVLPPEGEPVDLDVLSGLHGCEVEYLTDESWSALSRPWPTATRLVIP